MRQQPFTATLSPFLSLRAHTFARRTKRMEWADFRTFSTMPVSSTMPVNISGMLRLAPGGWQADSRVGSVKSSPSTAASLRLSARKRARFEGHRPGLAGANPGRGGAIGPGAARGHL